jgi:hypothetical protein
MLFLSGLGRMSGEINAELLMFTRQYLSTPRGSFTFPCCSLDGPFLRFRGFEISKRAHRMRGRVRSRILAIATTSYGLAATEQKVANAARRAQLLPSPSFIYRAVIILRRRVRLR